MTIHINKSALAMAASAFALCLAMASPSLASQLGGPGDGDEGGGCLGQEGGCPHDPPPPRPLPHTPAPVRSDGNSTIRVGNDYSLVHSGGDGAISVSRSSGSGSVEMSTSVSPIASATSHVIETDQDHFASGDIALFYSVIVTASNQAAADGLTNWLAAGNEIGSAHGTYSIAYTDVASAQASLTTGFNVDGATSHSFGRQCSISTADPCGSGAFNVSMDFVPGAGIYINASPLDFYSSVFMAAGGRAGASGLGHGVGEAWAYIDPFISLNFAGSGLDPNDFTLTLGDGSVANAAADGFTGGGGVPEPATWGLMIVCFGLAGATLRRRRAVAA